MPRETPNPQGSSSDLDESGDKEKRARILRAALDVCGQTGVPAARMEEIAARAKVSKGTLYRFFASREDLLLAAILDSYARGQHLVDAQVETAQDPREQLARLCAGLAETLAQVGENARVYYQAWGIVAGTPEFEDRLLRFLRSFHADRHSRTVALVRAGQAAGVFRSELSPVLVADALTALLAGFIYRATFDPRAASPEALRACLDALVRGALEQPDAQRTPETSGRL
jgi:AcrR family transcriptional regulator